MSPLWIRTLLVLCLVLHVLLVGMHLTLVGIWSRHLEHQTVVSLERSATVATWLVFASQVFIIVYTAALLVITQRLALWSMFMKRLTLTAAHDVYNAWTGLGSSLISLWRQMSIPAAVFGTTGVALYLTGISVIHISTPSIFSMDTFNQTNAIAIATTKGMPEVHNTSTPGVTSSADVFLAAAEVLPYLRLVSSESTLGLANGTLYDIINANNAVGNVSVEGITANVTCGILPSPTATQIANLSGEIYWNIESTYDGYNISMELIGYLSSGFVRIAPYTQLELLSQQGILGRNVIFFTTFNITDSEGDTAPDVAGYITPMQMVGCTLAWNTVNVTVDAGTRFPYPIQRNTTPLTWETWMPQLQDGTAYVDDQVDSWGDMLSNAAEADFVIGTAIPGDALAWLYANENEEYIVETLGVGETNLTVTLNQFVEVLNNLTAAGYWSAGHVISNTTRGTYMTVLTGEAYGARTMSRLNINIAAVAAGLGASVVLTLLAMLLTRNVRAHPDLLGIDSLGILQFSWLVAHHDDVRDRIVAVDDPKTGTLRATGMMEITAEKRRMPTFNSINSDVSYVQVGSDVKHKEQ